MALTLGVITPVSLIIESMKHYGALETEPAWTVCWVEMDQSTNYFEYYHEIIHLMLNITINWQCFEMIDH